jgi:hypothetical protein
MNSEPLPPQYFLCFLIKKSILKMKNKHKILLVIALLNVFSFPLVAQNKWTKEQLSAHQAVINMFDALSKRDSVSLKASCTLDITLFEYGQIWNLDTLIRKAITQNTGDFNRKNTFDFISTTTDKSSAWLTYRLQSIINRDGKQTIIEWLETVTLAKQKKQWKVKHLHSTLIKRV